MPLILLDSEFLDTDIQGIYVDSDNVSKIRVYQGGALMGVCTRLEYDENVEKYKCILFEGRYTIPLSRTNCIPFSVHVFPKDADLPPPDVWVDTVTEPLVWSDLPAIRTSYEYTQVNNGGAVKLVAQVHGESRFLTVETAAVDESFASPEEERAFMVFSAYKTGFRTSKDGEKFILSGFALSLPFLSRRDAFTLSLKHENGPLPECLARVWSDYKNTDAYKKAIAL